MWFTTGCRILVLEGGGCFEYGLGLLLQQQTAWEVLTTDELDPHGWWFIVAGYQPDFVVVNGSGRLEVDGLAASMASLSRLLTAVLVVREDTNVVTVYEHGRARSVVCAEVADFLALFKSASVLV